MFFEKSERLGRQRLKFPKAVWSSAEQQLAVKGRHVLVDSFITNDEKELGNWGIWDLEEGGRWRFLMGNALRHWKW